MSLLRTSTNKIVRLFVFYHQICSISMSTSDLPYLLDLSIQFLRRHSYLKLDTHSYLK